MNKILCSLFLFFIYTLTIQAQNNLIISENWVNDSPSGSVFRKISLQEDIEHNIYVAGHLLNPSGNHDIIIQKYNPYGDLLWENTYDGMGNGDDFTGNLYIDSSQYVFLTGAVTVSSSIGFSVVALKYDSLGSLEWDYVFDNDTIYSPLGGCVDIVADHNYIYITGTIFGAGSMSDFITIKLDKATGSEIWAEKVDNNSYRDIAVNVHNRTGYTIVSGVSEIIPGSFRNAAVQHNITSGSPTGMTFHGDTVTGITDILDVVTHEDNTYIVGTTYSPLSGYDWLMIWLDEYSNEVLRITESSVGVAEDKAMATQVDDGGNIYIAGYFTVNNEGKNIGIAKYDISGTRLWLRTYNGESSTDDVALKMLLDGNGNVFLTGYVHNNTYADYITVGYDEDGKTLFQIEYDSPYGLDDIPTDMIYSEDGLTIVGNCANSLSSYKPYVVNYSLKERVVEIAVDTADNPLFVQNEIIVRFQPEQVDTIFVNSEKKFIPFVDLVPDSVINTMSIQTGFDFYSEKIWASKIFIDLKTTDTISTTRAGDEIPMDKVWSAFVLHVKTSDSTLAVVTDSLNNLHDIIQYAHLNFVAKLASVPNDDLYSEQLSYKDNADNDGGIGIESAWDIEIGKNNVKVGIYDSEVDYTHEDFGDGTYAGSVIKGYDFCDLVPLNQLTVFPENHGTKVTGIIGAIKNNNLGISGIAGKDTSNGSGVDLYCSRITRGEGYFALVSDIINAIHMGAVYTPTYGFGFHIQNHTWTIDEGTTNNHPAYTFNQTDIGLLKDVVRESWKNGCSFVASRGNYGELDIVYPACYSDAWVTSVGASGLDGNYKGSGGNGSPSDFYSCYGQGMDFIAPGVTELIYTTVSTPYQNLCTGTYSGYNCFAGTSASAPHTSGAGALVMSEQNTPFQNHPDNLTGEDIENLMQLTADLTKGTDTTGYDDLTGHGLIRIDSLMPLIKAPEYHVIHYPGNNPIEKQITLVSSNIIVTLQEQYGNLIPGNYIANKYEVSLEFEDDLGTASYMGSWPLLSRGGGFPSAVSLFNNTHYDYSSLGVGTTLTSLINTYYYFLLARVQGNVPIQQFIPNDTTITNTPYSVWVYDEALLGSSIKENEILGKMDVFPVPSSDVVNIHFEGIDANEIGLSLISLEGKIISTQRILAFNGNAQTQIDVKNISSGIYFIKAEFGSDVKVRKIVVE